MSPFLTLGDKFQIDLIIKWSMALYLAVALLGGVFNALGIDALTAPTLDFDNVTPQIDVNFIILYLCFALVSLQSLVLFLSTKEAAFRVYSAYIAAITVQVIFYEELYLLVGLELPEPWRFNMRQSTGVFALVWIIQFARILLNTAGSSLDSMLKIAMFLELLSAIGMQFGMGVFFLVDFVVMGVIGFYLIAYSSPLLGRKDPISLVFCLSFAFNYAGYFLSAIVFQESELALRVLPLGSYGYEQAGRFIWVGGLAMEAMLMSLAAYIYFRNLKFAAIKLESHAGQLERAIEKASLQLAEMEARMNRGKPRTRNRNISRGLREVIESYATEQFLDVSFLCRIAAMSKATLGRRLKEETGLSPVAFIRKVRLELAKKLMEEGGVRTVREAANASGFINHGHFSKRFQEEFDLLPAEVLDRKKAKVG